MNSLALDLTCGNSKSFGIAGWSSPVARQAHNLKVAGSNPAPATNLKALPHCGGAFLLWLKTRFIEFTSCVTEMKIGARSISEEIEEYGFAIVPRVLRSETVDELVADIEHALANRAGRSLYGLRHLHQAVPAVHSISNCAAVRELVEVMLRPEAVVARSLLFDKTPAANWNVAWHQDLTIAVRERLVVRGFSGWSMKEGVAHVQPPARVLEQMLTVRLHLDDCYETNGPLRVIPGSHKSGRLDAHRISEWRERKQPIVCAVPRGGALLMRPLLLHASSSAIEPSHRRVIHLEFAAGSLPGGLRWLEC